MVALSCATTVTTNGTGAFGLDAYGVYASGDGRSTRRALHYCHHLPARSDASGGGIVGDGDRTGSQSSLGQSDALDQNVTMKLDIIAVAKPLGVAVHDRIIVGRDGHASLWG